MANTYAVVIKDTATWAAGTFYLKGDATAGQEGIDSTTGKRKIGPGYYNALPYLPDPPASVAAVGDTDFGGHKGVNAANGSASTDLVTKSQLDAAVVGLLDFKGLTDCSANPNYPAASKGDAYLVSVAGKIGGASGKSVDAGDMYLATADNAGGTEASVGTSWGAIEHNLVGAVLAANNGSDFPSPATVRTNLGLVIGTDVAPVRYSALLSAIQTLPNSIVETPHWTPANVAAGVLAVGTLFQVRIVGNFDNKATSGIFTGRLKVNGTTILTVPIAVSQTSLATATPWWVDFDVVIEATGALGTVSAYGWPSVVTAAGASRIPLPQYATITSLNLTAGCQFSWTVQMATADAANIIRTQRGDIFQRV